MLFKELSQFLQVFMKKTHWIDVSDWNEDVRSKFKLDVVLHVVGYV